MLDKIQVPEMAIKQTSLTQLFYFYDTLKFLGAALSNHYNK